MGLEYLGCNGDRHGGFFNQNDIDPKKLTSHTPKGDRRDLDDFSGKNHGEKRDKKDKKKKSRRERSLKSTSKSKRDKKSKKDKSKSRRRKNGGGDEEDK